MEYSSAIHGAAPRGGPKVLNPLEISDAVLAVALAAIAAGAALIGTGVLIPLGIGLVAGSGLFLSALVVLQVHGTKSLTDKKRILAFFNNEHMIPYQSRGEFISYRGIVGGGVSDQWLEKDPTYIQWLFPTTKPSSGGAPVVGATWTEEEKKIIRDKVRDAFTMIERFYSRNEIWKNKDNHHQLGISRIFACLQWLGLEGEMQTLQQLVSSGVASSEVDPKFRISKETYQDWAQYLTKTGSEALSRCILK